MPSLAGKPPFATDEPDSFYETPRQPAQRRRQPPDDPNKRTSAYDVYDNYLAGGQDKNNLAPAPASSNRTSGIGNLLLNMDMGDDSDDSDDEDGGRRQPANPPGIPSSASPSKNAVLAAATGISSPRTPVSPSHGQQQRSSPPLSPPVQQHQQRQPSPQPIAAPRPGYAAPIAALNLARPDPVAMPMPGPAPPHGGPPGPGMQQRHPNGMPIPPPLRINMPQPQTHNPFDASPGANPFANPMPSPSYTHDRPPLSPSPSLHSSTPHPLQPPVTPITPAFIRPAKKTNIPPPVAVKFEDGVFAPGPPGAAANAGGSPIPRKGIIRGDGEGTLLPTRGEKGDDFWRRFSMVVKEENQKGGSGKESSWLRKTKDGYSSYSRWVWIVGMSLLILIAGGVAAGVYFTRNNSPNSQPKAFGGSANQAATFSSTATGAQTVSGKNGAASTVLHVSPTNTVQRRDGGAEVLPTGVVKVASGVLPTEVPSVPELAPKNLSARGSTGHFGVVKMKAQNLNRLGHGHVKSRLST